MTRVTALECSTGEMSSLRGPEGREDKNGESAARLTMDAESEDVMEDSLDEIDEEGYDSTSTEACTCVLL